MALIAYRKTEIAGYRQSNAHYLLYSLGSPKETATFPMVNVILLPLYAGHLSLSDEIIRNRNIILARYRQNHSFHLVIAIIVIFL
ncbi:MAG: hypothetical protein LBR26_11655 [Prevotella sp.]|nr:hypothetical protein [Prevotella sp.]